VPVETTNVPPIRRSASPRTPSHQRIEDGYAGAVEDATLADCFEKFGARPKEETVGYQGISRSRQIRKRPTDSRATRMGFS
jgi:hypothetical protein